MISTITPLYSIIWVHFKENMQQYKVSENVRLIFWILFLVAEIHSQTSSDGSQQPNRFRSCVASSYCTLIRRCSSLRDGWNRRGVGITCGPGSGPYRMVCCPRIGAQEVRVRPTRRFVLTTPKPPLAMGHKDNCGLSQGMDWFQEHAEDADAMEATWPWMVAIRVRNRNIRTLNGTGPSKPLCSGFLVDKIHVLSAAGCFWNPTSSVFSANIGNDDQDLGEEYPIADIKIHEDFRGFESGSFYNDIAILTLAREVNVSNFVPICLPDDRMKGMDLTGWGATVVGWGSEDTNGPMSDTLKQLDNVPILNNKECEQIFRELPQMSFGRRFPRGVSDELLCAGQTETSRDACLGDSGGPLMILYKKRWYAVGITSFGHLCGRPGVPGGYTRITSYVDWIKQNTENIVIPKIQDDSTQIAIPPR